MTSLAQLFRSTIKDISLRSGIYNKTFFGVYPFCFEPNQLVFLTECVKDVADIPGCIVEGGVLYGATTVFLNKFIDSERIKARPYYAIDTFSGFVSDDANYEVKSRKKPAEIFGIFSESKKAWFDRSMRLHDAKRVKSVECDIRNFDFAAIAPISFCLLDVDFYKSTKDVLPKIYAAMAPGGIIVIDDCHLGSYYDGAAQAYEEFIKARGLPREIVHHKLGVIRISRTSVPDRQILGAQEIKS